MDREAVTMTDGEDFLAWVRTTLYEAELAIHNGDAAPRRALWSRNEPVSILGALRNAYGRQEVDEASTFLERNSPTALRTPSSYRRMAWWVTWPMPLAWSTPRPQ